MQQQILKYPRTRHIESSKLQPGDEDLSQVRFEDLVGKRLVVEEKMDGANAGISFNDEGGLMLQSRGHFLTGGPRERHWTMFKQWANVHCDALFDVLGGRYIMFGEWMYAKHTVFYDRLNHYFMEFDVYDKELKQFLSTPKRQGLLKGSPVSSVLVLESGTYDFLEQLTDLVGPSNFKSPEHLDVLKVIAAEKGVNEELVLKQTDTTSLMEGLYIKVEDEDCVLDRLKWVRPSFMNQILDSETHWLDRTIIPNQLGEGIDIFSR